MNFRTYVLIQPQGDVSDREQSRFLAFLRSKGMPTDVWFAEKLVMDESGFQWEPQEDFDWPTVREDMIEFSRLHPDLVVIVSTIAAKVPIHEIWPELNDIAIRDRCIGAEAFQGGMVLDDEAPAVAA